MDKEDVVYICNGIRLSHKKKNKIPPFATTGMDLEGITLGEISQTEKDGERQILYIITYMWNLKNETNK